MITALYSIILSVWTIKGGRYKLVMRNLRNFVLASFFSCESSRSSLIWARDGRWHPIWPILVKLLILFNKSCTSGWNLLL